jgi:hypothetical protein
VKKPFHIVKTSFNDKHTGYEIYFQNQPFLVQAVKNDPERRLRRMEALVIANVLNSGRMPAVQYIDKSGV